MRFLNVSLCTNTIPDATVNRNSDKENGTTYTVTPTKDPSNNSSAKQTVSQPCRMFIIELRF